MTGFPLGLPGPAGQVSESPDPGAVSPEQTAARIAAFAKAFEVAPPATRLRVRKGKVYLTEDLVDWCAVNGASLDWICLGNPMPALMAYRELHSGDSVKPRTGQEGRPT